ncbi:MAG TPA: replication initiator, partial [Actinomycetes bacterium]|nr:replication initiator [Actinomycetes bacterium]
AAGLTSAELAAVVRVSYAKVAEYQRRGVVHFHALIRLDGAGEVELPPPGFTAEILERAIREAARRVAVPWPCRIEASAAAPAARWGDQLEIHRIAARHGPDDLSAETVAAYIAKYATKSAEDFGGLDHRVAAVGDLAHPDLGEHVARLVRACWALGGRPELAGLRLRQWAHQLGFGGHFLTGAAPLQGLGELEVWRV